MTAVANQPFTAAQFNQNIRDNFNQLAPAKAGTPVGGFMCSQGANNIVQRNIVTDTVATSESTTASGYGDLATSGPTVTATCRSALVIVRCQIQTNTIDAFCGMTVEISGGTNHPADTEYGMWLDGMSTATQPNIFSSAHWFSPLNNGANIFTAKYGSNGTASATFANRTIIVIPF